MDTFTPAGTEQFLASVDVPLAGIAAWWLIVTEIGGGALLIAGALTPLVALVSVVNIFGAIVFVHAGNATSSPRTATSSWPSSSLRWSRWPCSAPGRFSVDGVVAKPAAA